MDTLHALNEKQVIGYREDGYLSPVKIISGTEAAEIALNYTLNTIGYIS